MRSLHIRTATPDDSPAIARLSSELGYPNSPEQINERLSRLLQSSNHAILVAEQEAQICGWIACEKRLLLESGVIYEIVGLVVDPMARRNNVGRLLVAAAEQWANTFSADVLRVRSNVKREESHPFYQALGFERGKTQHAYFKKLGA